MLYPKKMLTFAAKMEETKKRCGWLSRFRHWQEHASEFHRSSEEHVCRCCGETFVGNFCPTCGQKGTAGTFSWKSVRQGVMDVWGMGTRSLPYSVWQLLWRPGHFIREYVTGHLQVSFPPVKMLVIVALVATFLQYLLAKIDPVFTKEPSTSTGEGLWGGLGKLLENDQWAVLSLTSLLIVPTWLIFRYAPRLPHHTLPQNFFIQVLCGTQLLVIGYVFVSIGLLLYGRSAEAMFMMFYIFIVTPIIYLIDYKQLFGYSWWGTFWRVVMVVLSFFSVALALISGHYGVSKSMSRGGDHLIVFVSVAFGCLLAGGIIFILADFFNRKLWREQGMVKSILKLLAKTVLPLLLYLALIVLIMYFSKND